MNNLDISIVIPIFNEEECVEHLYERVHEEAVKLNRSYEIILVDDGSSDKTPEILKRLAREHDDLRVIKFRKNYGQTPAMVAGFDYARGDIIITMDGDLQNDPGDMQLLLEKMAEGYEVVSGWRHKRQDALIMRKIPSMCANKLISVLTGVHLHDYGCSLKAYKAECIRQIHCYAEMHRFFPAVASITGARTAEIPVRHYARTTGQSKYGISRTFKVFADLFTMLMLTRFSARPGLFFGICAIPFVLFGFLFFLLSVAEYLSSHEVLVVYSGGSFLMFMLVGHFILLALLSMIILRKGSYKADKLSTVTAEVIQ